MPLCGRQGNLRTVQLGHPEDFTHEDIVAPHWGSNNGPSAVGVVVVGEGKGGYEMRPAVFGLCDTVGNVTLQPPLSNS